VGITGRLSPIGIERLAALGYYVHDLDRTRRFLTERLDFEEIAASSPGMEERGGHRGAVLRAGDCTLIVVEPTGEGGPARRFLSRHPEGIGTVYLDVDDAARAFALIEERGGTPITDVARFTDEGGELLTFSIVTPFGDTTFQFVERGGFAAPFPGFVAHAVPRGGRNRCGFGALDHITANLQTMTPALLWMEHVLGFERCWDVRFHTRDVAEHAGGSGLKSTVMVDPRSGVKLATNEPWRPFFRESQVSLFADDHRGDGVQHAALTTPDILSTVRRLRERGVAFRSTPRAYYDALPERLLCSGVGPIDESLEELSDLQILVDGSAPGRYLLQIFLAEAALAHEDPRAGPFFFEIIQRKGDAGFGAGNFRALFESIEHEQRLARRSA
jgi:4-hydroxyphenylpyruvate dioxygenase